MFDGKFKAVTFSYDDGVTQDRRLIECFNKYGLRGTFNINSGLLGTENVLTYGEKACSTTRFFPRSFLRFIRGTRLRCTLLPIQCCPPFQQKI